MLVQPQSPRRCCGASALELMVIAPVLILVLLGLLQIALLYRANAILTYATFEAARIGATENAQFEPMMSTLLLRLMPLATVSQSTESAGGTQPDTQFMANLRSRTRLERISPDAPTFNDWGEDIRGIGLAIPNSHLLSRSTADALGAASGLNLAEANLLKIMSVHGVELNVPLVGPMIAGALARLDPAQTEYYRLGLLPLTSSVTLRMQSRAFQRWNPTDDVSTGVFGHDLEPESEYTEACYNGEPSQQAVSSALTWISTLSAADSECTSIGLTINELFALQSFDSELSGETCDVSSSTHPDE